MATLAVSNITTNVTNDSAGPGSFFGQPVEFFRIASAGAVGDTATLTPRWIKNVKTVMTQVGTTNALAATSSASAVVITLAIGTVTASAFDAWVFGSQNVG